MATNTQAEVMREVRAVRSRLRKFAPEVLKEMDKANRAAAKPILDAAKASVPPNDLQLQNWTKWGRYRWDSAEVKRGFKFKQDKKKKNTIYSAVLAFFNQTAAGSIWELAGYRSSTPFTRLANQISGRAPRGLWRQLEGDGLALVRMRVVKNYQNAQDELNKILAQKRTTP